MAKTPLILFFDGIPFIFTFVCAIVLFGHFLYLGVYVFGIKQRSEIPENNFWVRSLLTAVSTALVVLFIAFVFVILLFSPMVETYIPEGLLFSVATIDIGGIIDNLSNVGTTVLMLFVVLIVIIILVISLIMLELLKVNFGWTTLLTWFTIAIYLFIDTLISIFVLPDGLAGLLMGVGMGIRNALVG